MNTQEKDCWFHGRITRENAAHLVTGHGRPSGYFLVRESLRMPGSFVLTMWAENTVHHFQIVGHGDGWFSVDNGPLFQGNCSVCCFTAALSLSCPRSGLDELVRHYQEKSDGLPEKLSTYVSGHPPPLSSRKRMVTSLHKAVASNNVAEVRSLLSFPPSFSQGTVDSPNMEGQTPVHEAAKKGFVDVLRLLLEQKPDVSLRDSKGATALHVRMEGEGGRKYK